MTLSLQNVSVTLGDTNILNQVSFEAKPGHITAILGPNGAGKSTALKILSGDLEPSHGTALYNGQDVASLPAISLAKDRAVLPQHSHIAFPLRVWELVRLGRSPFGDSEAEKMQYVRRALASVDAEHLSNRMVMTLSGGERQRVFLAKSLTQIYTAQPTSSGKYLLLDEPTSALDLKQTETVMRIIQRAAVSGVGVVMIVHDIATAKRYADHIILLKSGHTFQQGKSSECLSASSIARLYDIELQTADNAVEYIA